MARQSLLGLRGPSFFCWVRSSLGLRGTSFVVRFVVCCVCVARVEFFFLLGSEFVGFEFLFARFHAFLLQFRLGVLLGVCHSLLFGSEVVVCECHDEFVLWFGSEVCGCE